LSFTSLADLENVASQYPVYCAEIYAVAALSNELNGALVNYTNAKNGYDSLFDYYVEYIKDMIPVALQAFMNPKTGPGNKYLDCTWNDLTANTTTQACPFPQAELSDFDYELYFTLKDSDAFYNDLSNNYGIDPSWIKPGDNDRGVPCTGGTIKPSCGRRIWHGFPMEANSITVPNPKDVITAAEPSMSDLQNKLLSTYMDLLIG
jgi:hypothetical protein